jgi:ABC-type antimicrobial peptide transport system permease subunit
MALGATPRSVIWLALRQGLTYAVAGVVAGTAGGLFATRFMRPLVYGIPTTDPLTYIAVAALGLAVAFLASWIPARRASRTDPLRALRAD